LPSATRSGGLSYRKTLGSTLYTFFKDMTTLTIAFHENDTRVADRRFRYVSQEYLENGGEDRQYRRLGDIQRAARDRQRIWNRQNRPTGYSFCASEYHQQLKTSSPDVLAILPALKYAIPVEESEFWRLGDEDRFTCVGALTNRHSGEEITGK
jgi:hypothetical protein